MNDEPSGSNDRLLDHGASDIESPRFLRGWGGRAFETSVVTSRRLTPTTHGITLEKPDDFSLRPVQFTFLELETDVGRDVRPMSLASSPTRRYLEYGVRISESPYKHAFVDLAAGDRVRLQGPFGDFILDEQRPAVFLAGGIGITPLKGMAEYAADKKLQTPVRLAYSNRTEDEIVYRAELEELERRNPRFEALYTLTGEKVAKDWPGLRGRFSQHVIRRAAEGLSRPIYYLCGKPSMVSAGFDLLLQMDVPEEDMKIEVFRGYWN